MATNLHHMSRSPQSFALPFRSAMSAQIRHAFYGLFKRACGLLLLPLILMTWGGCKAPDDATELPSNTSSSAGPVNGTTWRYLALGDSYTIGESVAPLERWPNQLQAELEAGLSDESFDDATILATTGWTTSNLSQALSSSGYENESWDLVSLLIGVNNQYQGAELEQYEVEYEDLLQRAISAAGARAGRVFVVSIPDYGYTPFGVNNQAQISTELEGFNAACKAITELYGVAYFNITPISQQWPEVEGLVAGDGLHPSPLQYAMWVDAFHEQVRDLLQP